MNHHYHTRHPTNVDYPLYPINVRHTRKFFWLFDIFQNRIQGDAMFFIEFDSRQFGQLKITWYFSAPFDVLFTDIP